MHSHIRHATGAAAAALLLAGALAGCGQGEEDDAAPGGEAPAETGEAPEETAEETAEATEETGGATEGTGEGPEVTAAETELGTILVDEDGMTLYLFTQDSPGQSVCEDDCLEAWPPLEGEPTAGEGVDDSLLGSIERSDGTVQATYGDWPLYYFAQDMGSGDVNGQGVNDVWWVVDPAGEPIQTMPGEEDDDGGSAGGRDY
ncbi:COG4315 family predicted lipoprotein [Ornithinicoccus halotolerans]|uniref:COG4315 family predicted lipoprotein n=1 Tax=Ornithinicoccus halotolerans TaxID=1748220 RepID=UPI0012967635|nr:hypothetical protein [Ornithinicoccus halotolerans]